jgi:peptidoglycan hydrolase CwlO-like protein
LELSLKSKSEEKKIIERDIERMKQSLECLALERSQRAKDLELLDKKYWEQMKKTDEQNDKIEKLKEKIRHWKGKYEDLEWQMKQSQPEMEILQEKLALTKQDLAAA